MWNKSINTNVLYIVLESKVPEEQSKEISAALHSFSNSNITIDYIFIDVVEVSKKGNLYFNWLEMLKYNPWSMFFVYCLNRELRISLSNYLTENRKDFLLLK